MTLNAHRWLCGKVFDGFYFREHAPSPSVLSVPVKFYMAFSYFIQKDILRDRSQAKINKTQLRYSMTLQTERDRERQELQAKINKSEMGWGAR